MSERSTEKKIIPKKYNSLHAFNYEELYFFSNEDQVIASRNCYPEMKKYILLNRVGFYRSRIL